jgi:hypothetical protein
MTHFVNYETPVCADWLNAVDATVFEALGGATTPEEACAFLGCTGGTGTGTAGYAEVRLLADLDIDWDGSLEGSAGAPGMIDGTRTEFLLFVGDPGDEAAIDVGSDPEIAVYVDGVAQRPGTDFTASGSALLFASPPGADSAVWGVWFKPMPTAAIAAHAASHLPGGDDSLGLGALAFEDEADLGLGDLAYLDATDVGPGGIADVIWRLERIDQPVSLTFVGDSTSACATCWVHNFADLLAARFPAYTVDFRQWSDDDQAYGAVERIATGAEGAAYFATGANASMYRATVPDSAAASFAGDFSVRVKINLDGHLPSANAIVASHDGLMGNRAWYVMVLTTGKVRLVNSADGTAQIIRDSTVALSGGMVSGPVIVRADLDVDNGSGGNTATFYTSTNDGMTWTQLGTTVTLSGITGVFDSTAVTQLCGFNNTAMTTVLDHDISFYSLEVYGSLDETNRAVAFDVGSWGKCGMLVPSTFLSDLGQTVTVTNGVGSCAGSPRLLMHNGGVGGTRIDYAYDAERFPKLFALAPDAVFVTYGLNSAAITDTYPDQLKQFTDLFRGVAPRGAIVMVLENQRIAPAPHIVEHAVRTRLTSQFAAANRFDIVPIFGVLPDSLITPGDGIHPTTDGYVFYAQLALNSVLTKAGLPVPAPATPTSPGTPGEVYWDGNYVGRCVAPNTWISIAATRPALLTLLGIPDPTEAADGAVLTTSGGVYVLTGG